MTVTGCPWYGDGFGFPFWRGLGYDESFWTDKSSGWAFTTATTTASAAITTDGLNVTSGAKLAVETATSADLETVRTMEVVAGSATATATSTSGAPVNAARGSGVDGAMVAGAALAGILAVVGVL